MGSDSRPAKKAKHTHTAPPAWFDRVMHKDILKGYTDSADFDEDLSDLDESSEDEYGIKHHKCAACQAGKAVAAEDCHCQWEQDGACYKLCDVCKGGGEEDPDDCECCAMSEVDPPCSERSYDGSDAEYYYVMKEEREERKRQLRDVDRDFREELKVMRAAAVKAAAEVREAYARMQTLYQQEDARPALDLTLEGGKFYLYCVEYVDHITYDTAASPSICFDKQRHYESLRVADGTTYEDEEDSHEETPEEEIPEGHLKPLLYIDSENGGCFDAFIPPERAGLTKHTLAGERGQLDAEICFLSNEYLMVTVPPTLVFGDEATEEMPERFEFIGIRTDILAARRREEGGSSARWCGV